MKVKSISSLKREAWQVFSYYIRLRDCLRTTGSKEWGECITCDNQFEFKYLDAGHFIPGRHNGNLFSEKGVNAQCRACNRWGGGKQLEYRRQIIKLYGEGVDLELEEEARQTKRFTIAELEKMLLYYKDRIKQMEVS